MSISGGDDDGECADFAPTFVLLLDLWCRLSC